MNKYLTVRIATMTESHGKTLWRGIYCNKFELDEDTVSFHFLQCHHPSTCRRRSTMMWIIDDGAHCTIGSAVECSIRVVSAASSYDIFSCYCNRLKIEYPLPWLSIMVWASRRAVPISTCTMTLKSWLENWLGYDFISFQHCSLNIVTDTTKPPLIDRQLKTDMLAVILVF